MAVRQIIVRGRVVDVQHREPVRGVVVEFVAYVEGGRAQPIGTATTLGTGFFVVRVASVSENLRAEHFGLRVFDANGAGLDVSGGDPRWPAGQAPETIELLVDAPVAQEYDCSDGPTLRRGYTAVSEGQGWSNTLRVGGGSYALGTAAIVGTITGSDGRTLPNMRVRLTFRGLGTTYLRPAGHPGINTTYDTDPVRVFELARTYTHDTADDDDGTYRLVYPTELTSVASDWRGQGWSTSGDGWDAVQTESPNIVVLHIEAPLNSGAVDLGQAPSFGGTYQEVDRRILFLGSLETGSVQVHDFMVGSLALEEDTEFHRLEQKFTSLLSRYYDAGTRTVNAAFGPADVEALALAYDEDPRAVAMYFLTHKLADEVAVHANRSRNMLTTTESLATTQAVLSHQRCYGMVRAGVPSGSAAFLATPLIDCKCALETAALNGTIRAQSSADVDTVGNYLLHAGVGHNYTHSTGTSISSPIFRENSVGAVLNAGTSPTIGTLPSGMSNPAEAKALAIHRALYVFEQHRRGDHAPRPGVDVDLWSTDAGDPAWDGGTPSNNSLWNLVRNGKDWEGNDIDSHGAFDDEAPFFDFVGTNAVLGDYADGVSGVVGGFRSSSWAPADVALASVSAIAALTTGHSLPATYSTATEYATAVKERASAGQWNAAFEDRLTDAARESDADVRSYVSSLSDPNLRRLRPSWADVSSFGSLTDPQRRTLLRNLRQRVALAKLGGRGEEATVLDALLGAGITSARQIATAPKSLISALPDIDADAVRARAVHQTMAALTLYVDRHPNSNNLGADPDVSVLGFAPPSSDDWDLHDVDHPGDVTDSDRHGYVHYPEWRTVFSPLAYLADLLRWIDARGGWSNSGGLQDRRPDLEHIHLSEENTYHTVRYLDIVLEVLEVAAATLYDSGYAPFGGLLKTMKGDEDGPSTYLFERAYTHPSDPALHEDTWPLRVPFDLPGTRLHRFLPLAGVARWQVMDVSYDVSTASTALPNVHGSVINVPAAFVTELGAAPSAAWFNSITPTDVDVVAVFMDHFGLTLDETRHLTRMQALHPTNGDQRDITMNSPFSFQNLVFDGPAWDATALHAVSRILRLRNATGWDFHTLDLALRAAWTGTPFGTTITPDQTSLKHLAGLQLLAEHTGSAVGALAAWYADLDTYGDVGDERSAYERAFLADLPRLEVRGDTTTAPGDPLQVSSDGTEVLASAAADSFADVGTGVRTALGLSEAEYTAAMAWMNSQESSPAGDPLTLVVTLRRLSRLHRIVSLARAVGSSVDTTTRLAVAWRADGDVFADSWETLDFLSGVAELREAGLSLTQALWVVENPDWTRAEQDPGVPDLQTITEHLGRLRQGIRAQFREILTRSVPEGAEADWGDSWEASLQALVAPLITSAELAAIVEGVVGNQSVGDWTTDLAPVQDALGGAATFNASQIASDLAGIPVVDVTVRGLALNTALRDALTHLRSYELVREALEQAFPDTALARSYAELAPGGTTLMADILTVADLGTVTLTDEVPDTPWADVDESSAASAFAAWRYAVRVDLLVRATGWTADDLTWFVARSGNADLLSPVDLPTTGTPSVLKRLLADLRWSKAESTLSQWGTASGLPRLRDVWDDVAAASSDSDARTTMAQALGTRLTVGPTEITALMSAQGYASATQANLLGLSVFERVVDGGILITRLGVSAAALAAIGSATPSFDDAQLGIDAARAAFPSVDGWEHAANPIWQQLKEIRRSVLVDKLRHAPATALTEDALLGQYLIDVSMTACGRTSRVKQAISTTQQYIQRWLLGLESGPTLSEADRRDWQWMKSYRVWEAARRVFMYPENWLDAEFRTGTHLFEKLKQELAGDALTWDSAARAYEHYLTGLHEVGHLQVVSIYDEALAGLSNSDTDLHVLAKTRQDPSAYYYRRRTHGKWTAWEPVEVGLEGEHIYLVRHMGRVLAVWAAFEDASERVGSGESAYQRHRTAVRWHWSTRNSDEWTKPQTTVKRLYVADNDEIKATDTGRLQFRVQQFVDADAIEHLAIWYMGSGRKMVTDVSQGNRGSSAARRYMADDTYYPRRLVVWDVVADGLIVRNHDDPLVVAARAALPEQSQHRQLIQSHRVSSANRLLRQQYVVHGSTLQDGSLAVGTHRGFQLFRTGADFVVPHQGWNFAYSRPFIVDTQSRQYLVEAPRVRISAKPGGSTGALDRIGRQSPDEGSSQGPSYEASGLSGEKLAGAAVVDSGLSLTLVDAPTVPLADLFGAQARPTVENMNWVGSLGWPDLPALRATQFDHPMTAWLLASTRLHGLEPTLRGSPAFSRTAPLLRQALDEASLYPSLTSTYFEHALSPFGQHFVAMPEETFTFDEAEPQGAYNWELFFHVPMLVAQRFTKDGQFDEARRWLEFIFDPTTRSGAVEWRFAPFSTSPGASEKASFDRLVDETDGDGDGDVVGSGTATLAAAITHWAEDPFDVHRAAAVRPLAYRRWVVKAYVENLLAWGDDRFARYSIESINEARQLYVLAADILGPRPVGVDAPAASTTEFVGNFLNAASELSRSEGYEGGEAWASIEPPNLSITDGLPSALPGLSDFFGIPANDKLLGLWDTVADRLFKIRHCLNLQGEAQPLPLFEPPIDPALLVRARARGADLSGALRVLATPLPHHRFSTTLQRAQGLVSSVRSLGQALLSAMEKRDSEELARIRSEHEVALLDRTLQIRELQVREAEENIRSLEASRATAEQRQRYYVALVDQGLSAGEVFELGATNTAQVLRAVVGAIKATKETVKTFVPDVTLGISGFGPHSTATIGDDQVVGGLGVAESIGNLSLDLLGMAGGLAGRLASYARRKQEWEQQLALAELEIEQINVQLAAANVRLAVAEKELSNQELQREQSERILAFMTTKYTNKELYSWMVNELKTLHFQTYRMAVDMAQRAERCFKHEMAKPDAAYIQVDYYDAAHSGLLAGERLQHDLERMDATYAAEDRREYELTKSVCLSDLDGVALERLRHDGFCFFYLPEVLFDLDAPGHYLRRIRRVTVSIPCVTGPNVQVYAKLTLLSSKLRTQADRAKDPYQEPATLEAIVTSVGQDDSGTFNSQDARYQPFEFRGAVDSVWKLELLDREIERFDHTSITDVDLMLAYSARDGGETAAAAARSSIVSRLDASVPGFAWDTGFDGASGSWMTSDDLSTALGFFGDDGGGPPVSEPGALGVVSARRHFPDAWHAFMNPEGTATSQLLAIELAEVPIPHAFLERSASAVDVAIVFVTSSTPGTDPSATVTAKIGTSNLGGGTATLSTVDGFLGMAAGEVAGTFSQAMAGTLNLEIASGQIDNFTGFVEDVGAPGPANFRFTEDGLIDILLVFRLDLS